jgi:hypothetical protein
VLAKWRVELAPEFDECKKTWRSRRARFDMHLAAIRLNLERDPFHYSTPFLTDGYRVIESVEYVNDGFIMTAYVRLHPDRFVAEIMWVELRTIPVEDEDEDEEFSDS